MGGPMGVNDLSNPLYPWLKNEIKLIKHCLEKNIGFLGICLGAQLLAKAAGGDVQPLKNESQTEPKAEIGWSPILSKKCTEKREIMSYFDSPLDVLHWHSDRICLPKGSVLLASSKRCKEQFFQIGPYAYGLQFHIEVTEWMFNKLVEEDKEFIVKGLGQDAENILYKQQLNFSSKSKNSREKLIRGLLEFLSRK